MPIRLRLSLPRRTWQIRTSKTRTTCRCRSPLLERRRPLRNFIEIWGAQATFSGAVSVEGQAPHNTLGSSQTSLPTLCGAWRAKNGASLDDTKVICPALRHGSCDLFQLPNFDGAHQFWMLNMVCHGTSFQLCERVKSKEPAEVWASQGRAGC